MMRSKQIKLVPERNRFHLKHKDLKLASIIITLDKDHVLIDAYRDNIGVIELR